MRIFLDFYLTSYKNTWAFEITGVMSSYKNECLVIRSTHHT